MESAVLVHGKLEPALGVTHGWAAEYEWFPALRSILQAHNVPSVAPDFPGGCDPEYPAWKAVFGRLVITEQTRLIGHSVGAGFILRWLSEHPSVRVGEVVLVAPSLGLNWADRTFFDCRLDRDLCSRTAGLAIFGSDNDSAGIQLARSVLRDGLPDARFRDFADLGHYSLRRMTRTVMQAMIDELLPDSAAIVPDDCTFDPATMNGRRGRIHQSLQPA